jgi:hypothetical protein
MAQFFHSRICRFCSKRQSTADTNPADKKALVE